MKTLFENWRKYIKEARSPVTVRPQILHDIGGYGGEATPSRYGNEQELRKRQRPSVGYGLSDYDVAKIKTKMEDTPQDWFIITAKNIGAVEDFNTKDRKTFLEWFDGYIAEWLSKHNKPQDFLNNTIFLVIQSPNMVGDEKGPDWFIHDLGHSIYYIYEQTPAKYKPELNLEFLNYVQERIKGVATADFDRLPDVFAKIILGKLSKEEMQSYAKDYLINSPESKEAVSKTIEEIFDYTNWWVNKYLKRGPKDLNFVGLWNPTDPNFK